MNIQNFLLTGVSALIVALRVCLQVSAGVIFGVIFGAVAGYVAGWIFEATFIKILAQAGLSAFDMWEIGAGFGFIGGFFSPSTTVEVNRGDK